ncbi:MAG: class I SAM-dependent methyltransferase [Symploca sp. SIO2E6]|nr:class I SAM-dependent methyltransferase [Symploca sp. SIO2E6]
MKYDYSNNLMLDNITSTQIENMTYVEFISFIRETNRCPGGKNTIRKILQNTFINSASKVLELGSNTGFTSLEIARVAKCHVVGIDVVESAVIESCRELSNDVPDIQKLVKFEVGSALNIPYPDNTFDLVVVGGATSFIENKQQALEEYYRVLRPWGFLSVTNLYYHEVPPETVVQNVSAIIGIKIESWNAEQWLELFNTNTLFETYLFEKHRLNPQSSERISEYVEYFLKKDHLCSLPTDVKNTIRRRWRQTIDVFNENHKYLGFMLTIFRKRALPEEPELF